eukprot:NODE_5188_length_605_cov_1.047273.p4 GENE.NODE_5188_length_605_cov_1.047273~~NODE_5188_length_605_cov_1.047273.p4  ORF type:complete len:80 (+),score=5.59 NODE_5188_length_605_cov_1.047273:73-312(+)
MNVSTEGQAPEMHFFVDSGAAETVIPGGTLENIPTEGQEVWHKVQGNCWQCSGEHRREDTAWQRGEHGRAHHGTSVRCD